MDEIPYYYTTSEKEPIPLVYKHDDPKKHLLYPYMKALGVFLSCTSALIYQKYGLNVFIPLQRFPSVAKRTEMFSNWGSWRDFNKVDIFRLKDTK